MTREEQINGESFDRYMQYTVGIGSKGHVGISDPDTGNFSVNDLRQAFEEGAEWADEHPISKYNMLDIDYIKSQIEGIREDAEHITSGNITHNSNAIKMKCDAILKCFSKIDLLS